MFSNIFSAIDDTLIDEYFQPVCDHIRKKFGWTKSVLAAIALIVAIIGLAPLATVSFVGGYSISWIFFVPAGMMLFWILVNTLQAACLIPAGFRSETMNSTRLTGMEDRKMTMILLIIALPVVIATLIAYPDTDVRIVALTYLISDIGNICAGYFKACTDPSEQRFSDQEILSTTRVFYE